MVSSTGSRARSGRMSSLGDGVSAASSGEFERIARYFAPLSKDYALAFKLRDDAAVLRPEPGQDIVVTTDCMVAGVHFFPDAAPERIAQKLLRVNLSDLAAMGARPAGYLLAAAWTEAVDDGWLARFVAGLAEDQARFKVALIGGDTAATPGALTLTVTALGTVKTGAALKRGGAKPGDGVYVSGTIGDAYLGLQWRKGELPGLDAESARHFSERFDLPEPRLALGGRLIDLAHAAIDISDGLVADLGHICEASKLGAEVAASRVPLSQSAAAVVAASPDRLPALLTGGDDYELCFAVPAEREAEIAVLAGELGLSLTRIGHFRAGSGVTVAGPDGTAFAFGRTGYRHF